MNTIRVLKVLTAAVVALALGLAPALGLAQASYPNKPVWVISPLGSGGAVEIVGRIVTRKMLQLCEAAPYALAMVNRIPSHAWEDEPANIFTLAQSQS